MLVEVRKLFLVEIFVELNVRNGSVDEIVDDIPIVFGVERLHLPPGSAFYIRDGLFVISNRFAALLDALVEQGAHYRYQRRRNGNAQHRDKYAHPTQGIVPHTETNDNARKGQDHAERYQKDFEPFVLF